MSNSNGIDYFPPKTVTDVKDSAKTVTDELDALAELLWAAIQQKDLKAVATFTKFINGMSYERPYRHE